MTAQEAIDRADALLPNTLESAEKLRWLSELDGRLGASFPPSAGRAAPRAPVRRAVGAPGRAALGGALPPLPPGPDPLFPRRVHPL